MQKSGPLIRGKIRRVLNKTQTVSRVLLQTKFAALRYNVRLIFPRINGPY